MAMTRFTLSIAILFTLPASPITADRVGESGLGLVSTFHLAHYDICSQYKFITNGITQIQ